jgi:1-phosphofructokinase
MIYTVTLNPSIDYIVRLDSLVPGITNRTTAEEYYYGGKGINVSCVLAELDLESTAFGFVAGFTGDAIEKGIRNDRIITDFIKLESGISRINIKIKAGVETEINCQGPHISEGELERLFSKIDRISDGDTIVIAGNIPNTMPDDVYERILERIKGKDVRIVVDATKKLLLNASRSSSSRTDRNFPKCSELKSTPRMILKSMQKSCRNSVQKMF